jgi:hypothetical protein
VRKTLLNNRVVSFRVPYLTRRVAQSAWEFSASGCSSSAAACGLCKPLGRVSLDAHVDEQRRKQAEARVPFLLVSFLWARKEKTLAYRRKTTSNPSIEIPMTTSNFQNILRSNSQTLSCRTYCCATPNHILRINPSFFTNWCQAKAATCKASKPAST